jgi:hypothetical protein
MQKVAQSNRLKQQKCTLRTQKTIREQAKSNVWQNICKSKREKKQTKRNKISIFSNPILSLHRVYYLYLILNITS